MWFMILMIMIFVNLGLGIAQKLIDIFEFFTKSSSNKKSNKKKLVE